jgi:hypothetical protein
MGVSEQLRALAGELEDCARHLERTTSTVARMIDAGVKLERDQASLHQVVKVLEGLSAEWALVANQLDHRH